MVTNEDELGAGIALADQDAVDDGAYPWDFVIDETGDLDHTRGYEELYKDLSFQIASKLDGALGAPFDSEALRDIGVDVERIVLRDPRIEELTQETVVGSDPDEDAVHIRLSVRTTDANEYALVFRLTA